MDKVTLLNYLWAFQELLTTKLISSSLLWKRLLGKSWSSWLQIFMKWKRWIQINEVFQRSKSSPESEQGSTTINSFKLVGSYLFNFLFVSSWRQVAITF